MPIAFWCLWIFILGLMVGSFLNVLIARLPHEKSIIWPSSRCFNCYHPIRFRDNLPIVGYLRLRGKCRYCSEPYSSRYLWVELGTGLSFLALFILEIQLNVNEIPSFKGGIFAILMALPFWKCCIFFFYHAVLLSGLIASAVIDAEHRIIPPLIPYTGVVVGVVGGAIFPWPWPNPVAIVGNITPNMPWNMQALWGQIPLGLQPWPFWGPPLSFAQPGTIQMGILTALCGALAGSLVVRLIKWLFEVGFGREAMGLGDADLLMMAGAFLGWQIAVMSLFVGAVAALVLKILGMVLISAPPEPIPEVNEGSRELPFGPGLALGVVVCWLCWHWLGPRVQFVFYDGIAFGISASVMCIGMVAAGLLLRRPEEAKPTDATPVQ